MILSHYRMPTGLDVGKAAMTLLAHLLGKEVPRTYEDIRRLRDVAVDALRGMGQIVLSEPLNMPQVCADLMQVSRHTRGMWQYMPSPACQVLSRGAWRTVNHAVAVELRAHRLRCTGEPEVDGSMVLAHIVRGTTACPTEGETVEDMAAALQVLHRKQQMARAFNPATVAMQLAGYRVRFSDEQQGGAESAAKQAAANDGRGQRKDHEIHVMQMSDVRDAVAVTVGQPVKNRLRYLAALRARFVSETPEAKAAYEAERFHICRHGYLGGVVPADAVFTTAVARGMAEELGMVSSQMVGDIIKQVVADYGTVEEGAMCALLDCHNEALNREHRGMTQENVKQEHKRDSREAQTVVDRMLDAHLFEGMTTEQWRSEVSRAQLGDITAVAARMAFRQLADMGMTLERRLLVECVSQHWRNAESVSDAASMTSGQSDGVEATRVEHVYMVCLGGKEYTPAEYLRWKLKNATESVVGSEEDMDKQLAAVMARKLLVITGEVQYAKDLQYLRVQVEQKCRCDVPPYATAAHMVAMLEGATLRLALVPAGMRSAVDAAAVEQRHEVMDSGQARGDLAREMGSKDAPMRRAVHAGISAAAVYEPQHVGETRSQGERRVDARTDEMVRETERAERADAVSQATRAVAESQAASCLLTVLESQEVQRQKDREALKDYTAKVVKLKYDGATYAPDTDDLVACLVDNARNMSRHCPLVLEAAMNVRAQIEDSDMLAEGVYLLQRQVTSDEVVELVADMPDRLPVVWAAQLKEAVGDVVWRRFVRGDRLLEENGFLAMIKLVNESLQAATDMLDNRVDKFKAWPQVGTKFEVLDSIQAMRSEYKKLTKVTPRVTPRVAVDAMLLFLEPWPLLRERVVPMADGVDTYRAAELMYARVLTQAKHVLPESGTSDVAPKKQVTVRQEEKSTKTTRTPKTPREHKTAAQKEATDTPKPVSPTVMEQVKQNLLRAGQVHLTQKAAAAGVGDVQQQKEMENLRRDAVEMKRVAAATHAQMRATQQACDAMQEKFQKLEGHIQGMQQQDGWREVFEQHMSGCVGVATCGGVSDEQVQWTQASDGEDVPTVQCESVVTAQVRALHGVCQAIRRGMWRALVREWRRCVRWEAQHAGEQLSFQKLCDVLHGMDADVLRVGRKVMSKAAGQYAKRRRRKARVLARRVLEVSRDNYRYSPAVFKARLKQQTQQRQAKNAGRRAKAPNYLEHLRYKQVVASKDRVGPVCGATADCAASASFIGKDDIQYAENVERLEQPEEYDTVHGTVTITHKGDIMYGGVAVKGGRLVPSSPTSLVSVQHLVDLGYTMVISHRGCVLINSDNDQHIETSF